VAWFQLKHGLPVDGRATTAFVRHLRSRTAGPSSRAPRRAGERPRAAAAGQAAASPAPAWQAYRQLVGRRVVMPGGRGVDGTGSRTPWLLIALAALDVLLLLALLWQRRAVGGPAVSPGPIGTATTAHDDTPAPSSARTEPAPRRFAPPLGPQAGRPPGATPGPSREPRP
jgi:hypothetical protein